MISSTRRQTVRLIALSLLPAIFLTGCSQEPAEVLPTKVLEQENTVLFGKPEETQRILRKSVELAKTGYRDIGSLNMGSDYLNVRDGEVTFTETWAASWGVNVMYLVSVWPSAERLVFSSKDRNSVCWYAEITGAKGNPLVRYGVSTDPSCRATEVDAAKPTWQESTFPLRPITTQSPTPTSPEQ